MGGLGEGRGGEREREREKKRERKRERERLFKVIQFILKKLFINSINKFRTIPFIFKSAEMYEFILKKEDEPVEIDDPKKTPFKRHLNTYQHWPIVFLSPFSNHCLIHLE